MRSWSFAPRPPAEKAVKAAERCGIDSVQIARIERLLRETPAEDLRRIFSEQELKDLVTFYKTPLGQKLLSTEPRAIQFSMSYMNQWAMVFAGTVNEEFRAEMKKRNKPM